MKQGYEMQMPKIAELARHGTVRVMTLAEAGRWFSGRYTLTPATAMSAMSDYSSRDGKTVWFNSRFYRANLFWTGGSFRFRDIQVYNQDYKSLYLDAPGTSTECHYQALPFVDGCLWSEDGDSAGLRIIERDNAGRMKETKCGKPSVSTNSNHTIVTMTSSMGNTYTITMDERSITVASDSKADYCLELATALQARLPFTKIVDKSISAISGVQAYEIRILKGGVKALQHKKNVVFQLVPNKGRVEIDLAQK